MSKIKRFLDLISDVYKTIHLLKTLARSVVQSGGAAHGRLFQLLRGVKIIVLPASVYYCSDRRS